MEPLEGRQLMSATYTVLTTGDGAGSIHQTAPGKFTATTLRAAITAADNDKSGNEVIDFNIPGTGVHTISLNAELPQLTRTVTIDGSSQPGGSGSAAPVVVINVQPIYDDDVTGLVVKGANSVIKDIGVVGSDIGFDVYGSTTTLNGVTTSGGSDGVLLESGSNGNLITHSYFTEAGIGILDSLNSNSNRIFANRIGNTYQDGILLQGGGNSVGDGLAGDGNTIGSDNAPNAEPVGGNAIGIAVFNGANHILGNSISNSSYDGILLSNMQATDSVSGAKKPIEADYNAIKGNAIFQNESSGIDLEDYSVNGVDYGLKGNTIGGTGIIAGTSTQQANQIFSNGKLPDTQYDVDGVGHDDGITVSAGSFQNQISGNSIYNNAGPGIYLANGGNHNQAVPTLTSATSLAGISNNVAGMFNKAAANSTYQLEFFTLAGATCLGYITVTTDGNGNLASATSPSGSGTSVSLSGSSGNHTFNVGFNNLTNPVGQTVTSTATRLIAGTPGGDTSEFSGGQTVQFVLPQRLPTLPFHFG